MIAAILASTPWGGIGNNGTLPWPKHSEDLAWFKSLTTGHIVVMGRNTWDDPKMPKPLPDRINYVVSSRVLEAKYRGQVNWIAGNLVENMKSIRSVYRDKNIFIIGGKQVYESTIDLSDRIYWTRIKTNYRAETRLSMDQIFSGFRCMSVKPGQDCTYEVWDRIS